MTTALQGGGDSRIAARIQDGLAVGSRENELILFQIIYFLQPVPDLMPWYGDVTSLEG